MGNGNRNRNKDVLKEKDCKGKTFNVPSVREVEEYCEERSNGIDATHFHDYYSARGWMIGKNGMKDWKAAVRTWERNRSGNSNNEKSKDDTEWI